jgi:hypothetical protein
MSRRIKFAEIGKYNWWLPGTWVGMWRDFKWAGGIF